MTYDPTTDPDNILGTLVQRGETGILVGAHHVGKTILILQWMAAIQKVSKGEFGDFFGLKFPGGLSMAYISSDKTSRNVRKYAQALGLDLKNVRYWGHLDERTLNSLEADNPKGRMGHLMHILDTLDTEKLYDLIVIEGFQTYTGVNVQDYVKSSIKLAEIVSWNERHPNTALLGLVHATKAQRDRKKMVARAMDRVMGTPTTLAYANAAMVLESPEESGGGAYRWTWCPRLEPWSVRTLVHPDANHPAFDYADVAKQQQTAPTQQIARTSILDQLTANPAGLSSGVLEAACKVAGAEMNSYHRARLKLIEDGLIRKVGGNRGTYVLAAAPVPSPVADLKEIL